MEQLSYCLDVTVGYHEEGRERLIKFLGDLDASFCALKAQRGRMNSLMKLRIFTTYANDVRMIISEQVRGGEEFEYEIHYSEVDARRSMNFLPDFNNPLGDNEFNLDPQFQNDP